MTTKQLREWIFKNEKEDQWWLSVDGVTQEFPLTISQMEELVRSGEYGSTQILHLSQAEISNPPWIDVEFSTQNSATTGLRTAQHPTATSGERKSETLGVILVLLPLISSFLILFWVRSMNIFQGPYASLSMIAVGTVLLTALLIGIEASQLGIGSDDDLGPNRKKKTGPIGWAIVSMLLWIVFYPSYLGYRAKYGAKNLLAGGIFAALIFLASVIYMNSVLQKLSQLFDSL